MKLKGRDYKNKLKLLKITLLNQKINKNKTNYILDNK
jgi:hypothetical protein